ncbi:MAG: 4-alpha-glucanotransferase, partial [Parachlamydiales bacterium]
MKEIDALKKYLPQTPAAKHWDKIGIFHHHGIVIPLFSLRCENSSGIGEFLDLKKVIDWCKNIGFDVIQLLPLNETGQDPSPYNAISSCALNPIHISLYALDKVNENIPLKEKLNEFKIFNSYNKYHYL